MSSSNSTRKLAGILILSILISLFAISTGCLSEEGSEEPEDVIMDVMRTNVEEAGEGMKYLELDVRMENKLDQEIQIDVTWFEIETKEGLFIAEAEGEGMVSYLGSDETTEFRLIFEMSEQHQADILWFRPPYDDEPHSWTRI